MSAGKHPKRTSCLKHNSAKILIFVWLCVFAQIGFCSDQNQPSAGLFDWRELPPLPDEDGFAGMYGGVSDGALIVAGGSNYPNKPFWEGGQKVWYDKIYILRDPAGHWEVASERLPTPRAYGLSLSYNNALICIGGRDQEKCYSDVIKLELTNEGILIENLAPLPQPCAFMCGALMDNIIYLVGGITAPNSAEASSSFWTLDLAETEQVQWKQLEPCPGPGRRDAVAAVQGGRFFVFSGMSLENDSTTESERVVCYLRDAYCYDPGSKSQKGSWRRTADMPRACVAAPTPAVSIGQSHLAIWGGLDRSFLNYMPQDTDYPPFLNDILVYHTITDTWVKRGEMNVDSPPVSTPVVQWDDNWVIVNGETRPGKRTPKSYMATPLPREGRMALFDWGVFSLYLVGLVVLGAFFSKREKDLDDYFLGGRRVPWWAAAISIFATDLSAITYVAIPAVAYVEDWRRMIGSWMLLPVLPIVIYCFLPFYRRLNVTTAYEYLEKRFNVSIRLFCSAVYILSQLARIAVVVYLPSLALSAVTGINIYFCVAIMALLCILYTVLGGIEAVIWTDVAQTFILMGGTIICLFIIFSKTGGISEVVSIAAQDNKFLMFNWSWDLTELSMLVLIIGFFFSSLTSYGSNQSIVQRYLTTRNEKESARSLWANAAVLLIIGPLFYGFGTALYSFYKTHPHYLLPIKNDELVPWFVMQQLPTGLSGLVIAGIFAAAMSSLDSAMHSIATAVTNDFYCRFRGSKPDNHATLKLARWITALVGILGGAIAAYMATADIKLLFDLFMLVIGLLVGSIGGVFILAVFTKRASTKGTLIGVIFGAVMPWLTSKTTDLHFFLYTAIGVLSCVLIGYLASLFLPDTSKDLTGLTLFTLKNKIEP